MAKFEWQSKKELEKLEKETARIRKEKEILEKALPAMLTAVKKLVRVDELTPEELLSIIDLYPDWVSGEVYTAGDILQYGTLLYKVVQSHTSQADWLPDKVPALYSPINPPTVIGEWKQPTGAHDAYKKGDKVLFGGVVYENLIDGNTWSPKAHPGGWKADIS